MRRITYDSTTLVTSADVASALLDFSAAVVRLGTSAAVDIPVLERNGTIRTHSILIGPATQLEVVDIDGHSAVVEAEFPVPIFPPLVARAVPVPATSDNGLTIGMDDDLTV